MMNFSPLSWQFPNWHQHLSLTTLSKNLSCSHPQEETPVAQDQTPTTTDSQPKTVDTSIVCPIVKEKLMRGFFIDVINSGGYVINDKHVVIPPAQMPIEFNRDDKSFRDCLNSIKIEHKLNDHRKIEFQIKDLTTEQAINEGSAYKIALNFANEKHAGGGPGFHKAPDTHLFIYDRPSAKAQEESLSQRSDLMASLTQLPHTLKPDSSGSSSIRSFYVKAWDSRKMVYISHNHLFGVQNGPNFYQSRYLEEPKAVTFISSAASNHEDEEVDCSKNSDAHTDAKQRIETHLLAAALAASKRSNQDQPVELILGAFGCGVFAPKNNPNEYRQMIAEIYQELLPELQDFFDVITFAVPTFGKTDPLEPVVNNYKIFESTLKF
jgi:uncharacterized protein (TIGR02452 family)